MPSTAYSNRRGCVSKEKAASAQDIIKGYRKFNILSLGSGCTNGIVESIILERLQGSFSKLNRELDLIVGVSFGAIQALHLAADLLPKTALDDFLVTSKFVFSEGSSEKSTAAYRNTNLYNLLRLRFEDLCLRDLNKHVAIVTFNLNKQSRGVRYCQPKIFHNYDGSGSDGDQLVVDVAMRAIAVPTIFPTYQGYCDGALVAKNPGMVAIAQALNFRAGNVAPEQVNMLSLSTKTSGYCVNGQALDWGAGQWPPELLSIVSDGPTSLVDFQCAQLLRERHYQISPYFPNLISPTAVESSIEDLIKIATDEDLNGAVEWLKTYWK